MPYVCESINQITQACEAWVVMPSNSVLPTLTVQEAFIICGAITLVLTTAWGFRQLGLLIKQ